MELAHLNPTRLWELRAKCLQCRHEFRTYAIPDMSYGYWLLRSLDGETMAILRCFENPVFDEVEGLVKSLMSMQTEPSRLAKVHSERKVGKALYSVIPVYLDRLNGIEFTTDRPKCPLCKSSNVDEFDHDPAKGAVINLPVATFNNWLALTPEYREQLVAEKLRELGHSV